MNAQIDPNVFRNSPTLSDFDDFVRGTWKTTDEPWDKQISIAALGLTGEAGETVEHVKKYLRDGRDLLRVEEGQQDPEFVKELGDVLYYVFKLSQLVGVPIQYVIWSVVDKLNQRREDSGKPRVELGSDIVALPKGFVDENPINVAVQDAESPDESLSLDALKAIVELHRQQRFVREHAIDLGNGEGIINLPADHVELGERYIRALDIATVLELELCK